MENTIFHSEVDLELEDGGLLRRPTIAFQKWGEAKPDGSNVVWVCHALTANADVFDWWSGLFGETDLFNPKDYCIVCSNILGSCYGSTGPLSENPESGKPYYYSFPKLTVRDLVKAHQLLAQYLKIDKISVLIGGSLGGHQALQWAVDEPDRFENLIAIATSAIHSPWGIAFNESQRMAIKADGTWGDFTHEAGLSGMRAARSMALLSYRNYAAYAKTQARIDTDIPWKWRAISYQNYQGEKLVQRFNALSYYWLTHTMDSQDIGRHYGGVSKALERIKAKTLTISMDSDLLFPPEEQQRIAEGIVDAKHISISSDFGHDGFLIETKKLTEAISEFLKLDENRFLDKTRTQTNHQNTEQMKQKIGIIGHGTVGAALYQQINKLPEYEVIKVAVKHPQKHKNLTGGLLAKSAWEIIDHPDIHIVLEAIDNSEDALEYALKTLKQGKTFISASKKMLSENLSTLLRVEREFGGHLLYEAAVGGAIPVLRAIREHLTAEPISRIRGIINGSCNYILTKMSEEGIEFDTALEQAQELGYAESDPASDIDGYDTYYKAVLLAAASFGELPEFSRLKMEGIRNVSLPDVKRALRQQEKVKLIADIQRIGDRFTIDIRPTLIDKTDPLFHIDNELNGIVIYGEHTGPLLFQGPGAGGNPTASAMVGDLLNARNGVTKKVQKLLLALS